MYIISKLTQRKGVNKFNVNGDVCEDESEIAEIINVLRKCLQERVISKNRFKQNKWIVEVTEQEITKLQENLDARKAQGTDAISKWVLNEHTKLAD